MLTQQALRLPLAVQSHGSIHFLTAQRSTSGHTADKLSEFPAAKSALMLAYRGILTRCRCSPSAWTSTEVSPASPLEGVRDPATSSRAFVGSGIGLAPTSLLHLATHLVNVRLLVFPSPSGQASLFMPSSIRPAFCHNALQHLVIEQARHGDVLVRIGLLVLFRKSRNVVVCWKTDGRACSET